MKRLIRKQVDDVTAEQKLDTVFRPVAANIDRAWRLRPCGQSGNSGSDEDDDRDDAHGARNTVRPAPVPSLDAEGAGGVLH